jgi:hypothetical protein
MFPVYFSRLFWLAGVDNLGCMCQYRAAGNVIGQFQENVFPKRTGKARRNAVEDDVIGDTISGPALEAMDGNHNGEFAGEE